MSNLDDHMEILKTEVLERNILDCVPESKRELFLEMFLQEYKERIFKNLFQGKEFDDKNKVKVINEKISSVANCRKDVPKECVKHWKEKYSTEKQQISQLFQTDPKSHLKSTALTSGENEEDVKDLIHYTNEIKKLDKVVERFNKKLKDLHENIESFRLTHAKYNPVLKDVLK